MAYPTLLPLPILTRGCGLRAPIIAAADGTQVGGTSVAAPVLAGIISHKGSKYSGAAGALNAIYNGSIGNFRDITSGNCGPYDGYVAGMSWDLCTGRGSLLGGLRLYTAGATPVN